MKWREAVAERLFGDVIGARVAEALESERGWHPLTAGSPRDLPFSELRENLEKADDAYRNNPLAFRIVELGVDFVLGKGLALRCSEPAVQRWLQEWWTHPLNDMPMRQFDLCRELSLAGEVFVTLHTNPVDGMTYLRQVPAALIDQIETNPEDLEDEVRYHQVGGALTPPSAPLSRFAGEGMGVRGDSLSGFWWPGPGWREEGTPITDHPSPTTPVMRHYAVNRLIGTVRGQGDLVALLPWLRRYKDWLTDRVRLNKYRQAFLFDVTLTGADRRAILARQSELAVAPEPGSIVVHNEKENWRAVRPEIGADESAADGLALRLMIAAGSGFPLHFLGEAAEANLATATAMTAPALRRLERRQLHFGWMLVDLARECLRRSGRFGGLVDRGVDGLDLRAEFEELSVEDNERTARAAAAVAEALRTAREMGWLRDDEARELFAKFVGEPTMGG